MVLVHRRDPLPQLTPRRLTQHLPDQRHPNPGHEPGPARRPGRQPATTGQRRARRQRRRPRRHRGTPHPTPPRRVCSSNVGTRQSPERNSSIDTDVTGSGRRCSTRTHGSRSRRRTNTPASHQPADNTASTDAANSTTTTGLTGHPPKGRLERSPLNSRQDQPRQDHDRAHQPTRRRHPQKAEGRSNPPRMPSTRRPTPHQPPVQRSHDTQPAAPTPTPRRGAGPATAKRSTRTTHPQPAGTGHRPCTTLRPTTPPSPRASCDAATSTTGGPSRHHPQRATERDPMRSLIRLCQLRRRHNTPRQVQLLHRALDVDMQHAKRER